jgi:hypothetical protein
MVQPRCLTVRCYRAGVADTVFVGVWSDPRNLFALARRQRECDLRTPGLNRELAQVSGGRGA